MRTKVDKGEGVSVKADVRITHVGICYSGVSIGSSQQPTSATGQVRQTSRFGHSQGEGRGWAIADKSEQGGRGVFLADILQTSFMDDP